MGTRKNLTVGVTVNLEHYENLRLEVSGEVASEEDAKDLVAYLDRILGTLGRGDPETAKRVDSYRERVFFREGPAVDEPVECQIGVCALPKEIVQEVMEAGPVPEKVPAKESAALTKGPAEEKPSLTAPAKVSAASESAGVTCEECGVGVTPAEQKMSQLFTSRTLCRKCMKKT
ncbi:hypothetical protein J2741_000987 [Methanolinea mesophila]|uniref:hypothetical protein n=1 Tax=Methanolinea mesophila TaxID=547055 RepID=UPI001AE4B945|nr:hypothetical protein [Methanolinea mesophila]MBP1928440.1 hypothetical protein [Methanolinea mesophila]